MVRKSQSTRGIKGALARLLRECPQSREVVADVLEWVEQLKCDRQHRVLPEAAQETATGTRRGDAIKGYKIEGGRNGEMLVERRYDSPKDFRCGCDVYLATAETLATAPTRGMGFDAIMEGATKRLGWQPPEYLPRMCVRFWLFGKDPILIRSRARYEPVNPAKFVAQAKHAWRFAKHSKK